jgi:hypothetical protein
MRETTAPTAACFDNAVILSYDHTIDVKDLAAVSNLAEVAASG